MNWETEAKERNAKLDAFIATLGLEYTATFVPQSQSRNAEEKTKSLNWRVRVSRSTHDTPQYHPAHPSVTIATDYMQGIGHIPTWNKMPRVHGQPDYVAAGVPARRGNRQVSRKEYVAGVEAIRARTARHPVFARARQ